MKDSIDIPKLLVHQDHGKVTPQSWSKRAKWIKAWYEEWMYGAIPDAADEEINVEYGAFECLEREVEPPGKGSFLVHVKQGQVILHIKRGDRQSSYETTVVLPVAEPSVVPEISSDVKSEVSPDLTQDISPDIESDEPSCAAGFPVYLEMGFSWSGPVTPSPNAYYAASRGYASVTWSPVHVAADNSSRTGTFYDLYPYGEREEEQTGALAAWAWGASKIIDALSQGLGAKLGINPEQSILGGVSRYGKAVAVAGAFDKRIKVVVPACSGAGGIAMYRYSSTDKTYDFSELDGPTAHTTTANEPLGSLQSPDEGHWFNDKFKQFRDVKEFEVDQHFLAALSAAPDRILFIITGILGEDWTNPAAMSLTYAATREAYRMLGLEDHLYLRVHLQGHAILLSDMERLLDVCDVHFHKVSAYQGETDLSAIRTSVFIDDKNYDAEVFDAYVGKNLTRIVSQPLTETIRIPAGTPHAQLKDYLPKTVLIYVDDIRHMNVAIEWQLPSGPDVENRIAKDQLIASTIEPMRAHAKILLPPGITNTRDLNLSFQVPIMFA
ncbi:MAG: hypothetical protein LBM60_06760 [Clostridium sp.]|nr:hypothetical protein [Clostridium sp.]